MILDVPDVRQKGAADCGRACYRAVVRYWRKRGDLTEVDAFTGVHPLLMEAAFKRTGLRVYSGQMDVSDLRDATRRGKPVVCLVQYGESGHEGHYVICTGVSRGRVHRMCPILGTGSMPADEFVARWVDVDRDATVYRGHGICVWRE